MADAAAFFASKKKKNKKAFTFNANLVDASTVNATVHVEAPALSNEHDIIAESPEMNENNSEWDEQAVVGATNQLRNASDAVLDFKVASSNGIDTDDIASKLRVEETKAQLAAAREGMEREALKLKEEREKKEKAKEEASNAVGGGPAKWVAPSLRRQMGAAGDSSRPRIGGKLNVEDEELFPDLAAAGKILEQKEKESQPLFKPAKKTPVGGGASWASKSTKAAEPAVVEESTEEKITGPEPAESEPEVVEAPSQATIPVVKKPVVKKKKKDLSTFKPSS
ncbi:hypothetical protein FisN_11Hh020 [Fistulifera solaris]|uniref:Uncharacterized protein n=1 Tax=Fistulifera solaris TaxID=1519565 RepID=A0A1Z5JKI7_FISSO|nr:hypothetical protein FisN_11Hh020 [Fistulifera solaris]|eukprot:GAX14517.1 hypothetical protein FisN_11Hh020 [Fistulifera solaris]